MLSKSRRCFSGEEVEVPADLVVLMVGMDRAKTRRQSRVWSTSVATRTAVIESHPKLDPVATTTDGIFIAGGLPGSQGRHGHGLSVARGRSTHPG